MPECIHCLLCDWSVEVPKPQYAPGVASVFGITPDALALIHQSQNMHRLEADLRVHFSSHKVEEWVQALREAREEIAQLSAAVPS